MTGPRSEKGNGLFPGYTVLTVAGSDSGGGAGVQADLKTIMALDGYGTCAITALTAQNTLGVLGSIAVPGLFIQKQMEAVFSDLPPQAVKIGMLPNAEAIAAVAETLLLQKKAYVARGEELPVVLDPVMVSTSGSALLEPEALSCMQEKLFPLCSLLTPNLPEGEKLLGTSIKSPKEMEKAARALSRRFGCSILLKGGHSTAFSSSAEDCFCEFSEDENLHVFWFSSPWLDAKNSHGTGCTLSSAIACGLARGLSMEISIREAKAYLTGALKSGLSLGKGNGPLNHGYRLTDRNESAF